jgi:hypothetical protein
MLPLDIACRLQVVDFQHVADRTAYQVAAVTGNVLKYDLFAHEKSPTRVANKQWNQDILLMLFARSGYVYAQKMARKSEAV